MPAAFVVCPLVLLREKYARNNIKLWRFMLTNAKRVKSTMIELTGGTAFLRFYQIISG